MITLTDAAAKQILKSAEEGKMDNLALRLAAKQKPDGSMDYGMGFDEIRDDDMTFQCEGVEVVIAPEFGPLLKGATIDFVEFQPGDMRFIFMNPNDANYTPPAEEGEGGCGSGGCSSCS